MKTLIRLAVIAAMFTVISCQKESLDPAQMDINNISTPGTEIESAKVALYNDNGTDETTQFSSYGFLFNCNGTVQVQKNGSLYTGSWVITGDNENNLGTITLSFSASPLNELNGDWQILEQVSTKLSLQGINSVDLLTFEKV